jgi:hypothetical protein
MVASENKRNNSISVGRVTSLASDGAISAVGRRQTGHQARFQSRQIADRNYRLFVCGIDAIDTVVHSLPGMLAEKDLGCHAREAPQRAQRVNDLREYPAGDAA